jgi:hypothetical protein
MLEDITIKEFNSLDEAEQFEALWEYGQIVGHVFQNGFKFMLYQISNFYVEIKYDDETNAIKGLRAFEDTESLDPYLKRISLKGINIV